MRDPEDLRKFARVDYGAIARLKADYWRAFSVLALLADMDAAPLL